MRRSYIRMYIHYVWATWDRQPLIPPELRTRLYEVIRAASEKLGCEVTAIGGMPDHVHLLLSLPATVSVASVIHDVKGASSRWLNEQPATLGEFRWQGRYGAFSVSPDERSRVASYIANQEQHHRDGTIWPHAEDLDND